MRPRKKDSPWSQYGRLPADAPVLKQMAEQASKTSRNHAARVFGCSQTLIRRAMRIHGVKPRRDGGFTNAEALTLIRNGWSMEAKK